MITRVSLLINMILALMFYYVSQKVDHALDSGSYLNARIHSWFRIGLRHWFPIFPFV